ncbi:hypothetical protein HEK616_38360 [Streptomyces nigrescens]|uniref:Uncharacterized protein n=1 Tax=Streptomyces nigrescens TaxID=1920 RepID=A0ABN6QVZ1_STRNI|nr:hypothetical protein HEK616_38360 [Streptomyces nigrescens]
MDRPRPAGRTERAGLVPFPVVTVGRFSPDALIGPLIRCAVGMAGPFSAPGARGQAASRGVFAQGDRSAPVGVVVDDGRRRRRPSGAPAGPGLRGRAS